MILTYNVGVGQSVFDALCNAVQMAKGNTGCEGIHLRCGECRLPMLVCGAQRNCGRYREIWPPTTQSTTPPTASPTTPPTTDADQ